MGGGGGLDVPYVFSFQFSVHEDHPLARHFGTELVEFLCDSGASKEHVIVHQSFQYHSGDQSEYKREDPKLVEQEST